MAWIHPRRQRLISLEPIGPYLFQHLYLSQNAQECTLCIPTPSSDPKSLVLLTRSFALWFLDVGLWDSVVYHTLPKLPFPNILCKIKSSIFNFICRDGLSTFGSGSGWWHIFSISSKGDSQEIPWGSENGNQWLKGNKEQWRVILATWRTHILSSFPF